MDQPLAYRMRPKTIEEIVGQDHLVGENKIIWRMVVANQLSSMILYGPPGIGKTSIASAIAGTTKHAFRKLNAATDTKKDLQVVVEEGKMSGNVILLLDEIHRLDKPKQDFLLPHLESGRVILIGATTENPYISIHPAIRSRCHIFELKTLSQNNIKSALNRALHDEEKGLGAFQVEISDQALNHLAQATNGDLRSSLNALELAVKSTKKDQDGTVHIDLDTVEECTQRKAISHDKDGDSHYDVMSALQKSIRGSDVHAALHYAGRLIEAGELETLSRRLMVTAYEDIGLANPAGAQRAVVAVLASERLGLPEARIPLANAIVELCLSDKSNSAYMAINAALKDLNQAKDKSVPDHLKDSHYAGAKKLGRGKDYLYPHSYPGAWVDQAYLPTALQGRRYYQPKENSKFESALKHQYDKYDKDS